MGERIKGFLSRNWEAILSGVISTIIFSWGQRVFNSFWDFARALGSMSGIYSVLLWAIFSVGVGVIIYGAIRLTQRISKGNKLDNLRLMKDFDENYLDEITKQDRRYFRLWIVVQNGKTPVYDCTVELENLEYKGHASNHAWVHAPNGFDRKAMKWDVGYVPNEGKIDLNAMARKTLEIAVAFPQPMFRMELSHLDGYSERKHLLGGEYRVTLRVDRKVSVNKVKTEIEPQWYEVEFEYEHYGKQLKLLEVKEYEPE